MTKYHIVVETKYKRKFWFFKTIEYQRPVAGFSMIEYAHGKIYELSNLHTVKIFKNNLYSFHIEEVECFNNE